MKLAEALVIRTDLQNKISELETRLENNATVQEGETTAEDPNELLAQLSRALEELERLMASINLTNAAVRANGATMTELLAKRDCLKRHLGIMLVRHNRFTLLSFQKVVSAFAVIVWLCVRPI